MLWIVVIGLALVCYSGHHFYAPGWTVETLLGWLLYLIGAAMVIVPYLTK